MVICLRLVLRLSFCSGTMDVDEALPFLSLSVAERLNWELLVIVVANFVTYLSNCLVGPYWKRTCILWVGMSMQQNSI